MYFVYLDKKDANNFIGIENFKHNVNKGDWIIFENEDPLYVREVFRYSDKSELIVSKDKPNVKSSQAKKEN